MVMIFFFKHGPKSVHFTFMMGFQKFIGLFSLSLSLFSFWPFSWLFFFESPHVDKHEIINVQMSPLIKCRGNSLQADRSTLGGVKRATKYTYLSQWHDQPGGAALCSYCCSWRLASSSFSKKYSVDNPPDCQSCCRVWERNKCLLLSKDIIYGINRSWSVWDYLFQSVGNICLQ